MTVLIRDMSHYDTNEQVKEAGFVGVTHKVTEGTTTVDGEYKRRMNMYRDQGIPVLGAYHVLRTGSLQSQIDYWFTKLSQYTPWWKDAEQNFILQIDAEKWPYDQVSSSTVKAFAAMVHEQAPANCWAITYASKGQYGDSLTGIATDLWNARYGVNDGSYAGDSSIGWATYSGKQPVFLQYTSNPYDKNAFRGTLADLLGHFPGAQMPSIDLTQTFKTSNGETKTLENFFADVWADVHKGSGTFFPGLAANLASVVAGQAASKAAIDHLASIITSGGGNVDASAINQHIDQAVAGAVQQVVQHLQSAAQAEADALK